MICAGVEVILASIISLSVSHWTQQTILQASEIISGEKSIYVCFLADFRLILQQFHSSRSTVSTFIPPVRITKANFIKVKSRRQQQEGGCGVYWVFLC